jgi:hypothetical protein
MQLANSQNVKSTLVVIGFVMTITAITTAGYIYQSFAIDPFEKIVYAVFGIVFAVLGALFLPASGILWKNGNAIVAFICALLWLVVLFVIGTQTHLGFFAYSQNKTENASASALNAVKLKQGQFDSANTRAISLEGFSAVSIDAENTKLNGLKDKLASEQSTLAGCPKTYVKNCIKPAKENIATLESKIAATELTIKNATAYQAAVLAKETASTALLAVQSNPSSAANSHETVHPLFVSQAAVLSIDAKKMQSYFLAFSAVSFEALTAITWLVVGLLGGRTVYQGDYAYEETPRNRLDSDKANGLGQSIGNDKKPAKVENKQSLHDTVALAKEENNDLGKL